MKTLSEFKKDYKKITIEKFLGGELFDKLTGSLDEAIVILRELRNKYDSEYENLHIEIDCSENYEDSYINKWINLKGKRLENDKEFNERVERDYKWHQKKWDEDKSKYEQLKEKFEEK